MNQQTGTREKGEIVPILFTMHRIINYMIQRTDFVPLAEICSVLNFPRSTVSRVLFSLYQLGYLDKKEGKPQYRLCDGTIFKASLLQKQREGLRQAARDELEKLARNLGETTKFSIWQEGQSWESSVEVLCSASGNNKMHIQVPSGAHFPWHAGAASKVLLAFQEEVEKEMLLCANPLESYTENTITDINILQKELSEVRSGGFAYDRQEYQEGIEAIACPVFRTGGCKGQNKGILGALSVPYIAKESIRERLYAQKHSLLNTAAQIAQGYQKLLCGKITTSPNPAPDPPNTNPGIRHARAASSALQEVCQDPNPRGRPGTATRQNTPSAAAWRKPQHKTD